MSQKDKHKLCIINKMTYFTALYDHAVQIQVILALY